MKNDGSKKEVLTFSAGKDYYVTLILNKKNLESIKEIISILEKRFE